MRAHAHAHKYTHARAVTRLLYLRSAAGGDRVGASESACGNTFRARRVLQT